MIQKENSELLPCPKGSRMSYFDAPIAPVHREGRLVRSATLCPAKSLSLEEVYHLITRDAALMTATAAVRCAADVRAAKAELLPYVTPCGEFSRRSSDRLTSLSGYVVVDVDHLDSLEEAEMMRRTLFDDPLLCPALVFVSPSGKGVKAFVPYNVDDTAAYTDTVTAAGNASANVGSGSIRNATDHMRWAMAYVAMTYCDGGDADRPLRGKGVDTAGKDIVRSCFLCHDGGAMKR